MKVIGAGLPKTGTTSMAAALAELGYSVHDHIEHLEYNFEKYIDLLNGVASEDILKEMYEDVDAVVDTPACHFWSSLVRLFPDAKVVLTVREDPARWYESCVKTVTYMNVTSWWSMKHWYSPFLNYLSETTRKVRLMFGWIGRLSIAMDTVYFPGVISEDAPLGVSKTVVMNQYRHHVAAVQQLVPMDKLLIFNVKEGWEPLCKFLEKPVPSTPFPRENITKTDGKVPIIDNLREVSIFKKAEREVWRSMLILGLALTSIGYAVQRKTNFLDELRFM